jgi:glutathione S-transferase
MLPILYSYRRCPYAMRARMALSYAGIAIEIREISLKQKPAHMLQVSPKGTVPVLVLPDPQIIDQSLEIMQWALQQRDADGWLSADPHHAALLITENDGSFKQHLDRYKYADRFPQYSAADYRQQGELFLAKLELHLQQTSFLLSNKISLADIAIFPFIRQFAAVDNSWFESSDYIKLKSWLQRMVESALFQGVMVKYPTFNDQITS